MALEWVRGAVLRVFGWVFLLLGLYMLPRGLLEGVSLILAGVALLWYGRRAQSAARRRERELSKVESQEDSSNKFKKGT